MLQPAVAWLAQVGPWGLLVVVLGGAVWLYATDRIVSKGRHDETVEDRDYWRDVAMRALNLGEAVAGRVEGGP